MNKILAGGGIDDLDKLRTIFHQNMIISDFNKINSIRISSKLGRELLLNNSSVIVNGIVKWFKIKNLGLGVCEVRLNDESKETVMEK